MSLFWASNGLNELAEFPFNQIGKLTMAFFTGHLWRVLKSCYTGWVPEQGFDAVFLMDLARSRRTVPRNEKLAILSSSGRLVGVVSYCTMGLFCGPGGRGGGGKQRVLEPSSMSASFVGFNEVAKDTGPILSPETVPQCNSTQSRPSVRRKPQMTKT